VRSKSEFLAAVPSNYPVWEYYVDRFRLYSSSAAARGLVARGKMSTVEHIEVFGDKRELSFCAFCAGEITTRDHCPSRVLLDEPYPNHLPQVPACQPCNEGFSLDEEYFACLLACVLAGSTDPKSVRREKVRRILERKPSLAARLDAACVREGDSVAFSVEDARIQNVVTKLAQGHSLYELHEHCLGTPNLIMIQPLLTMTDAERERFEAPTPSSLWPEIGSRAMHRLVVSGEDVHDWIIVQPDTYRYLAEAGEYKTIRIVIQEYLACRIEW